MSDTPLPDGELELEGRIRQASNATFLARIGETRVVYKPVAGEQPLWDFPDGTLANREVAAFAVSEALGWSVVPRTWLREGPFGSGMVQEWQEADEESSAVALVPAARPVPAGWRYVLEGLDEDEAEVALLHEDSAAVRRVAVFDALTNNADRKGAHLLPMADGHRYGVDHGLTFHVEDKLRTILWGWAGEELTADERAGVETVLDGLDGDLGERLEELLTVAELVALAERATDLLDEGHLPLPPVHRAAIPWPPL